MLSDDTLTVAPDPAELRRVLGRFATGVTAVATVDAAGHGHAMTANAFTSVSLEPPLVLVCIDRRATTLGLIQAAGRFAVSVLADEQDDLATYLADPGRPGGAAQLADVPMTVARTGAPVVTGAVAWVDCTVHAVHDGGDHLIVVGRVVAAGARGAGRPLLFVEGRFASLADDRCGVVA